MAEDPDPGGHPVAGGGQLRESLRELARLHGVQLSYRDVAKTTRRASTDALLAVLPVLGAQVERPEDADEALRARRAELDAQVIEPVVVSWTGERPTVAVRPRGHADCLLRTEAGDEVPLSSPTDGRLELPPDLPAGYHDLVVSSGKRSHTARLIRAPRRIRPRGERTWGLFAPVYALRSDRDWGAGDLTDLEALLRQVAAYGGRIVSTLPMLSAFTGPAPFEPSPYAPVSRLHWNELFADPARAPELSRSPEARELLASGELRREIDELRSGSTVDYARVAAAKRRVLEPLAGVRYGEQAPPPDEDLDDYARFRAACDHHRAPWPTWPDGEPAHRMEDFRYHRYAQELVREQLDQLVGTARGLGAELYFDLPLGVHPDGYDTWRHRRAFALGVSGGAPPDTFFRKGQDWGFPPMHPQRIREDRHAYPIACIRHLLRQATILRIDHVMGLHRLFWVPHGMPATDGVYVRYPAEELYAVLCLEADRAGAAVVGEDLGTVPPEVRSAMRRHGLLRSYVLQYEATPDSAPADVPEDALASPNTHDMPSFASFWTGEDVRLRVEVGITAPEDAPGELADREASRDRMLERLSPGEVGEGQRETADALDAAVGFLAGSEARFVVVALEDLWGETHQQNVPGTTDEHPNWRRRMRHRIEDLRGLPEVTGRLQKMDDLRRER